MSGSATLIISLLYLSSGVFIFLLGLTILRVGRNSAPTRATALMLFFAGIGPLLSGTGIILESTLREGAVVYHSMMVSFEYLWEFYFPSLMLFALSFPRENKLVNRFPIIGFFIFLPYIFHLAVMMSGERMLDIVSGVLKALPPDKGVSLGSQEVPVGAVDRVIGLLVHLLERAHRNLFALVNIVYSLVALVLLWRNRRQLLNPRLARQMQTVAVGLSISVLCYGATKLSMMFSGSRFPESASLALVNVSLVLSGGTIAYAVIRQQFLGIRHVMRRALLYSSVAAMFAFLYLVVVRPISDFFGQYSDVGRDVFEAGFITLTIIAFQPVLMRTEELLERVLLKGRVDASRRFKRLGDRIAAVNTLVELEDVLENGFRDTLDALHTRLVLLGQNPGMTPFILLLEEIGEPVRRAELLRLMEAPDADRRERGWRFWRPKSALNEGDSILDTELRSALASVSESLLVDSQSSQPFDVLVPLFKGPVSIGYVGIGEKIYGVPYNQEEMGHLAVLSTQIGTSLQNIQLLEENLERKLLEEELKIARKIQMQLLPSAPPTLPGFELSAVTVPSRYVGGDYYDFVVVDDRWLVIVIADVSGKGIPASILTATLQATVRSNADAHTEPDTMMARLNRLLFQNTSDEEFATLFYAVVDLKDGRVRYANAGHEFPFIANGSGVTQLVESGLVLGCIEDIEYSASESVIPEHGALVLYTDGVTDVESEPGDNYGTSRLQSMIEKCGDGAAEDICSAIVDDVHNFGRGDSPDDLTLVVLKRNG